MFWFQKANSLNINSITHLFSVSGQKINVFMYVIYQYMNKCCQFHSLSIVL